MPLTVQQVFQAAGLRPDGPVPWGTPVPERRPGVYVVALTEETTELAGRPHAPISLPVVEQLLRRCPQLRVDGRRPIAGELADRLDGFWLHGPVLYIGLSSRPVAKRVNEFYVHRLGARSPHKGGWPLKTLDIPGGPWVFWAATDDHRKAGQVMLRAYAAAVPAYSAASLHAPEPPMPFANLVDGDGRRKRHGITGAS